MQAKQRNSKRPNRMDIMYAAQNKLAMSSAHRRRHACFCHVFPNVGHSTFQSIWLVAFVLVALNYCVNDTVAFNLENRLPIVKSGSADTYFGYSVAGHMIENDEDGSTQKWWVILFCSQFHESFKLVNILIE